MVVAAILHLGYIELAKGKEIDSSVIKDEKARFHLNMAAELLMEVSSSIKFCIYLIYMNLEYLLTNESMMMMC